ncbi:hypothetical protein KKA85_13075 [bacterium]|nr:hypothetical protein [bacterium]MBU1676698.1 hypothetical protein [bacterium]
MSRIFFVSARADEPPSAVADKAWRLCDEVLGTSGPAAGTPLAYHLDRHVRTRAETQFRGWTGSLPDRLRERGYALTPLAPVAEPERDGVDVEAAGGAPTSARLSRTARDAPGLLFCRRVICHPMSGLDGALAVLAYGCLSAAGKRGLQAGLQPRIEPSVCGGCGMCVTLCDRDGVRFNGHVSEIQPANCLACGDCLLECATRDLRFPPGAGVGVQKRLAAIAAAAAAGKAGRMIWLLFLLNEPERHGVNLGRPRQWPDLGLLAGSDPVALDCAARELIERETGRSLFDWCGGEVDPGVLLDEAERLGAGSSRFQLTELG